MEPTIRIKGFESEWSKQKAQEIFKTYDDRNHPELPVLSACQDIRGMAPRSTSGYDIFHDKANEVTYKCVLPGQFVIHLRSFQGGFAHSAIEGICSPAYTVFEFKNKDEHDDYYWKHVLRSRAFIERLPLITYGIRDGRSISFNEFSDLAFSFPEKSEQSAIASFLKKMYDQIENTEKKIKSLRQMRVASLQAMFPQKGTTKPQIRFKGFEDEWKIKKLCEISYKVITKNSQLKYQITLTNSAEHGIINQLDFFNHEISNGDNIIGYYVVENDDFVYNPRISVSAPVGPINRNLLGYTGVMSPLYYVFKVHDVDKDYLSHYFKTNLWHKYMQDNGNSGARHDRISITDDVFGQLPILMPKEKEEQIEIAKFFTALDKQISLEEQKLESLKRIKSACLDKMFV